MGSSPHPPTSRPQTQGRLGQTQPLRLQFSLGPACPSAAIASSSSPPSPCPRGCQCSLIKHRSEPASSFFAPHTPAPSPCWASHAHSPQDPGSARWGGGVQPSQPRAHSHFQCGWACWVSVVAFLYLVLLWEGELPVPPGCLPLQAWGQRMTWAGPEPGGMPSRKGLCEVRSWWGQVLGSHWGLAEWVRVDVQEDKQQSTRSPGALGLHLGQAPSCPGMDGMG